MAAQFVRSVLSGEVQDGSTDLLPNHDVAARSKKAALVPRRDLTFTPLPSPPNPDVCSPEITFADVLLRNVRRSLVRGVNAHLLPEAKKMLKI